MEDLRKISKIAALDQKLPGPICGDPDCEELCAEALEAAISLRLDPMEVLRTIIERELHCIPAEEYSIHACRFGFRPSSDSLVLGGEKKKKEQADKEEIIHIFRTGVNECKKCQALEGTRITPEIWADEEKMKSKGFWKQKNGEYLPHPNCKCHWEEKREKLKRRKTETTDPNDIKKIPNEIKHQNGRESVVTINPSVRDQKAKREKKAESSDHSADKKAATKYNKTRDSSFIGKEVEFYVKGSYRKFGNYLGGGYEINGFESLLKQLEDNYSPHSIGLLRIMGHGDFASTSIGGDDNFQMLVGLTNSRDERIISRLKRMLSSHSMIEFRMCNVGAKGEGAHENGPEFAQKLANLLGCRVKVYLEPVNPYGWSNIKGGKGNFGRRAEYEIYAPQS